MNFPGSRLTRAFALATALFTGGTGIAVAQQTPPQMPQISEEQVDAAVASGLSHHPGCMALGFTDRGGAELQGPEGDTVDYHQYDEVLKTLIEELKSYSAWEDYVSRLNPLGEPQPAGICVANNGAEGKVEINTQVLPPIMIQPGAFMQIQYGVVDFDIGKATPWGTAPMTPAEVMDHIDTILHVGLFQLNMSEFGNGIAPIDMDNNDAVFLRTVRFANAHAEAILFTMERTLENGGLDEDKLLALSPILYEYSSPFEDQISDLMTAVYEKGEIDAEIRAAFKASVIEAMLTNPNWRGREHGARVNQMMGLVPQGVPVHELFDTALEDMPDEFPGLATRFGDELAGIEIDGKDLITFYRDYWAGQPNDPAAQAIDAAARIKEQVVALIEQAQAQASDDVPMVPGDDAEGNDPAEADGGAIVITPAPGSGNGMAPNGPQ